MRWIKRLLLAVGALVVLAAGLLVAVVLLVNPNDYKDEIAKAAKEATGRELTLKGDLKLSVFPSVAIEVHDAALGNPAGFGDDPFVAIGEAKLVMRLWPLLSKHFEVKRVALSGLKIHLVTSKAGKGNWEGLGSEDKSGSPAQSGSGSAPTATISSVEISNSEIVMDDERDRSTRRFTDVNLKTGAIGGGGPVPVDLSLKMDTGAGTKPTEIAFRSPGVDLDLDEETLAVKEYTLRFGNLDLSGSIAGKKVLSDHELSGALKLDETSLRDTVAELTGSPMKTRDEKAFSRVGFESDFTLTSKALDLKNFKARLDDTQLTGTFGIADLDTTALVFDLKADELDVDRYLAPEEKVAATTKTPPVTLPLETLRSINARGSLQVGKMHYSGLTLEGVSLKVNAAGGDVKIGPTQAKLYGGSYRGNIELDARGSEAKVALDQHLAGIDFARFLEAKYDTKRFSGKGQANIVVTGRGRTDADIKKTLDGTLDFDVKDGALEGKDLWFEMRRARALIKREAAPEGGDSGRTKFDQMKGSGRFTNGTLDTKDLLMQTPFLKVTGNGTIAVPTSEIDLHINAKVYQVPASGAGAEMADMKTAADIPVRVTGTITDYKIRPDIEAALKGEVKEKVKEKKEELKQKAKDKLRELLGGG